MNAMLDLTVLSVMTRAAALGGGDFNAVLADLDIHITNDNNSFQKLNSDDINQLMAALEKECRQRHFPFAYAEVFNFDGLPELSAFIVSSNNIREASKLIEWIPRFIHPLIQIDGSQFEQRANIRLNFENPDGSEVQMPIFTEVISAVLKRFTTLIAPNLDILQRVDFQHQARAPEAEYQAHFGCPVRFGCQQNEVQFNIELLDAPLPGNLPPVHVQAVQTIHGKLLEGELAASLKGQIQDLLKRDLSLFSKGIESISEALRMHPRKLQRELKAEGHSYSNLLAKTRHVLALDMLRQSDLDIDSIGFKLGFEERRSFTSAFKKWQGQTPSAYRTQNHK